MGSVGGLLGLGGGASGSGFSGPERAGGVVSPTSSAQIQTAYGGTQDAMKQQQDLLKALQDQNGIGNQSQVYQQLQGVANGTGPNPALAQLNQTTGQNVANQAALMAGQRGAGANVGLMARQAGQQGGALQQQAVGQGATLQAQQALNAINAAGGMANTQAANQIGATTANTQAQQQEQQQLINAQLGYNNNQISNQSNVNNANASLANTSMTGQQGVIGGMMQAGGAAMGFADGGVVGEAPAAGPQSSFGQFLKNWGGSVSPVQAPEDEGIASPGGSSELKKGSKALTGGLMKKLGGGMGGGGAMAGGPMDAGGMGMMTMMAANGGMVPVLLSPGEKYLSPADVEKVKRGANPMKVGETVPGKPKVAGAKNSYANDTVPKKAAAGGIVVPRSETQSKNPDRNSRAFVESVLAKRKVRK